MSEQSKTPVAEAIEIEYKLVGANSYSTLKQRWRGDTTYKCTPEQWSGRGGLKYMRNESTHQLMFRGTKDITVEAPPAALTEEKTGKIEIFHAAPKAGDGEGEDPGFDPMLPPQSEVDTGAGMQLDTESEVDLSDLDDDENEVALRDGPPMNSADDGADDGAEDDAEEGDAEETASPAPAAKKVPKRVGVVVKHATAPKLPKAPNPDDSEAVKV